MFRVLEVIVASATLILLLSHWIFSFNVSIDLIALVSAFLYVFLGMRYLKEDRVIRGTIILVVSSMMAFIFIESFIPIT
ncbi:hypothetical protein LC065_14025 [Halobacillus litoralis]|uniref:hypothetical protein n=1 Tax=Halobacillus litoralis TaxID=45668 RepID=UPI001CFCEE46|nr:hypothetical protein [Halobacillus litoralis]WLR46679.1 hypothetical protein LC065_14025 [Halobacillus litoralis]